ncbi:unnamed protein product [Tuber aestivum]|uniref:L-serine ammonia-lyase n=1 Tax=Tuber aestivum TaxID=59557 RepID=A0A292Q509_9PEZI|nr:unnamed protein product [Tuber aestivum]
MVTTEANPTPPFPSQKPPWICTPLIESNSLSKAAGCRVHMKMDMFQPAGSFKSRGIGNYCLKAVNSRPNRPIRFYSSSGGNAGMPFLLPIPTPFISPVKQTNALQKGLAAVTASRSLSQSATVIVPTTTTPLMKSKIQQAGGTVVTHGASWSEADEHTRALVATDPTGVYCPPFDAEDIWEGNKTLVDELLDQLAEEGQSLDAVVLSVGGGGLLCGVQMGLLERGLGHIPLIAVEPEGAAGLAACLKADRLVELDAVTSIATSLGTRRVARRAFELACHGNVRSVVLSDAQATMGAVRLMDDERVAVEPACGISAAVVYDNVLKKVCPELGPDSNVVLVVCGGNSISAEMLAEYRKTYSHLDAPMATQAYTN